MVVRTASKRRLYTGTEAFDNPYNAYPGPSKIPGAGLEFPIEHFGEVEKVHLYQRQAVCEVVWKSGVSLRCFVHAQKPVGWFIFEGVEADFEPLLILLLIMKK